MAVIIEIQNLQKTIPLKSREIQVLCQAILHQLNIREAKLSLVFVTDRRMRVLNREFHGRDRATDVLAFDLSEEGWSIRHQGGRGAKAVIIDGEIIISTRTAQRQARVYHTTPFAETVLYLVHGLLHLVGYDDHSSLERKRMREMEGRIIGTVLGDKKRNRKSER